MKNNKIYCTALIFLIFTLTSCEKYLEVDLQQNQMTLEEVFDKRSTTEAYLAQVYGFLPNEHDFIGGDGGVVPRSDEALFSWLSGVPWLNMNNGSWGPTTTSYDTWSHDYQGINQATVFINNVDRNTELSQANKDVMKAEARFLRAYYYFTLLRKYGPVYIWGDQESDMLSKADEIDRHSLDQNIEFIISEYDKCIGVLPQTITDAAWMGRVTKGIVMAAKSRLLLYAARPLFNGTDLYKGMKNLYGDFMFPQTPDANKWETAAIAAKAVIDLNLYSLYEDTKETDPFRKAIKSYMGIYFEKWNNEIIWGRWIDNANAINVRTAPPRVVKQGYGGIAPSLKLVDTYAMAQSGRYPVTGYEEDGNPIIDPRSGYSDEGFTNPYIHPLDNFAPINAHNSVVGREARFYASVMANGMYWMNTYHGQKLVTFFTGGTSTYLTSGDCVKVGYLWRRFSDPTNDIESGKWGQLTWPYYRLAEVYLNYAEACNEKPSRDESQALLYLNKVRNRSGLNNLEVAYPEVLGNKILLRELIQKERMLELAFEGHRYFDIRTWMIAEEEFNGPNYTLNLLAKNYQDSWQRTDKVFPGKMVFQPKHYFFPINQKQLSEMKNITQNLGW